MSGPPPKHSSQRRRRNKTDEPITEITVKAPLTVKAPAEDREWHVIAKRWYRSLKQSGQAQFYEPSDWASAQLCAHVLSEHLKSGQLRAGMIHEIWTMMGDLLSTEAARRRVRMEISRGPAADDGSGATVTIMDAYRDEFGV